MNPAFVTVTLPWAEAYKTMEALERLISDEEMRRPPRRDRTSDADRAYERFRAATAPCHKPPANSHSHERGSR